MRAGAFGGPNWQVDVFTTSKDMNTQTNMECSYGIVQGAYTRIQDTDTLDENNSGRDL